jgi:hypothetical protein
MHDDLQPCPVERLECLVIPFPAVRRVGYANRVAAQLSRARSDGEASWALARAVKSLTDQMTKAGIGADAIANEKTDFLVAIHRECRSLNSKWFPTLPQCSRQPHNGGDAA